MNKIIWITLALFIFFSCEPPTKEPDPQGGAPSSDAYSLENCETNIANNVPDFYKNYFSCVSIEMSDDGQSVNISFNGLPPYDSWYWQNDHANYIEWYSIDPANDQYYKNPEQINEFDYSISIPVNPEPRTGLNIEQWADGEQGDSSEYPMGSVGSALNGVHMFNPLAAGNDNIEDEAYSFDVYSGHPNPPGQYHYHTASSGPLEVLESKGLVTSTMPGSAEIEVYGIMCDGVPVLGCTELDGSSPNGSDWDAQNGHVHSMVDQNGTVIFENRYHTHICPLNASSNHAYTPEVSYYKTSGSGVCSATSN